MNPFAIFSKKEKTDMGPMTLIFLQIGLGLFSSVLPLLEAEAKKTPNPADDAVIATLRLFVDAFSGGGLGALLKPKA